LKKKILFFFIPYAVAVTGGLLMNIKTKFVEAKE
jgi:hypothetical protein